MSDTQGDRPENTSTPSEAASAAPAGPASDSSAAQSVPPRPPLPGAGASAAPQTTPVAPYQAAPGYAAHGAPAQPYGGQPAYAGTAPYPGSAFGAHPTQPTLPLAGAGAGAQPPSGSAPAPKSAQKEKSGAGKVAGLIVAAALVGGAAGLGGAYAGVNIWGASQIAPMAGPAAVTVNDSDSVNATTAISAKVLPSVVTISASSGSSGGTGSGVILSEDGYIVTNTHVVTLDGASSDAALSVTTSDGRVFDAELVGTDPTYDLAVIKLVDASGLTPIEFADSADLNVGDQTVAIGAPLGLSNTVTTGIVSALNRSIEIASSAAPEQAEGDGNEGDGSEGDGSEGGEGGGQDSPFYFDFGQGQDPSQQQATSTISIAVIQTDAAINPGNSGGALVDSEGRLIGINVAIASAGSSGGQAGSIGVGFSIPSNVVERVTEEIIDNGAASHGLLGAMVAPATSIDDATITGAYIDGVTDGGAAASAGLQKGDIVTGFDDIPITDAVDLTAQVRAAAGGSTVTLTYVRGDETRTAEVKLGTLEQ